jgi:hypothetical protein
MQKPLLTLEYRDELKSLIDCLRCAEDVAHARASIAQEWRNVRNGKHSPRAMAWEAQNGMRAIVSRAEFRAIEARWGQI